MSAADQHAGDAAGPSVPSVPSAPTELRTERLLLRRWRAEDAGALAPVLEANVGRLRGWIPARVAEPAELAEIERRLATNARAFDDDREWRYAIVLPASGAIVGEVSLFPRVEATRVALPDADRAEIGYWLDAGVTGRGLATEAAAAMLDLARRLAAEMPALRTVEIRCDARNAPSAAVPRRLGFHLARTIETPPHRAGDAPGADMIWSHELAPGGAA